MLELERKAARIATAVARSSNSKIGDAAATYAAQQSCPSTCPFLDGGGCYAESGAIGSFVTKPLNAGAALRHATALDVARAEAAAIDALEALPGRPMRLHGVGDCASDEAARIVAAASERYMERGGGPVWTYTHSWRTVERASWGRVSVLASCETTADFAAARLRGYAPSIVVDDFPTHRLYAVKPESTVDPERAESADSNVLLERAAPCDSTHRVERAALLESTTHAGRADDSESAVLRERADLLDSNDNKERAEADKRTEVAERVLPCPAQTRHDVTCTSCRLCFNDAALLKRGYAIAFAVHGTALAVKKARLSLADPADPSRKLTSRDYIATHLARHGEWPTTRQVMDGAGVTHGSAYEMLDRMKGEQTA